MIFLHKRRDPLRSHQLFSYRSRLLLFMLGYSLLQLSIVVAVSYWYVSNQEYQDKGERALDVARVVAKLPNIVQGVTQSDSKSLQPFVEELRVAMGASFIVVGDAQGRRLAHPIPERIGKKMVGGDNSKALIRGQEYISTARGSLGYSVRGKVPIFSAQGQIIGIVSVGYLLDSIDRQLEPYITFMLLLVLAVISLNLALGWWMAQRIKNALLGYEPAQISRLYAELQATLNSIREGVISINTEGLITNINANAMRMLGQNPSATVPVGQHISDWLPDSDIDQQLKNRVAQSDIEIRLRGHAFIANRIPMLDEGGEFMGMVSSFRPKDEITLLTQQLSQIQANSEALRVQNHEHANKLNTIAGLIQLKKYQRALEFIGQENTSMQELIHFLQAAFSDPVICACLLGKYHRAHELGLELSIDPHCQLAHLPKHIDSEQLVLILSNLIDNAFEASLHCDAKPAVQVSISELGHDIIIDVEDHGVGISHEIKDRLFEKGVSSKSQAGHGIGLYSVIQTVELLDGNIEVSNNGLGTSFTVYLPKQGPLGEKP
ncbi:sensor histidine kinase [Alginatibacterium sediminis]|uniref:histidine kinase n=1 Tax=Alginatibacterium sediminis TaxID=2164068 RepID=A0A420ECY8_9ALTE|nr:sensor histidine kinase [Alginatibacterium sediminis]RKF18533.1 sensor histidine kinase [Alginatibacterium sediminis]